MSKITVPYCYKANSKVQVFDMETCKRSLFQIEELKKISEREEFAYFVIFAGNIVHPNYHSVFNMVWYKKDGTSVCFRIGRNKYIVKPITDPIERPIAIDSEVYNSRCV
jgi:hypothetical protein